MKHRLSITLDEETIVLLRDNLRSKKFRNKSHAIEYAIHSMLNTGDKK